MSFYPYFIPLFYICLLYTSKAHAFAMTFKDRPLELGELAFGLLANNLRFVVPNRNESNKSRWKTCRFWERFLGAVEVLKLQVPKQHNSLEETQQWLTEGGVISAVKSFYFLEEHDALGGLEKVGTMLDKARYSNSLSSKLTAHLQRINRTDLIPYIQYDTKHGKGGIDVYKRQLHISGLLYFRNGLFHRLS